MMSENEQKNEKRETVADIVEKMVRESIIHVSIPATDLKRYADRIEAAWEREREELDKRISDLEAYAKLWTVRADELRLKCDEWYAKAKPAGNAAAMRVALVRVLRLANVTADGENWDWNNAIAENVVKIVKEALSAPARNCDLKECSTEDGVISAHKEFCESWHERGKTCAKCPYNPRSPMMTCREKWLLAPAAERKGEGDGR